MRRWLILGSAVAMQVCLGGIYAWSIFVPGLQRQHALSMRATQGIFGGCILVFTLTMLIAGRHLPRLGPKRLATVGGGLFGAGYLFASLSGRFWVLFLGISIISGVGIGLAYVCPIVTCMKWFPKRKGLVTGVTVAGFGGGALALSTAAAYLLAGGWTVLGIFRLIGILYGLIIFAAGTTMVLPAGVRSAPAVGGTARPSLDHLRTSRFWLLACGMFSGTFAGLVVIGALESIGESWGMSRSLAVASVGVLALGNACGRIAWGWIADHHGSAVIPNSLLFLAMAMVLFNVGGSVPWVYLMTAAMIGFGFGACFVVYAAAAAHAYGVEQVGAVYPLIFLAYGISAVAGPSLGGALYDLCGTYRIILILAAALPAASAGLFLRYGEMPKSVNSRR